MSMHSNLFTEGPDTDEYVHRLMINNIISETDKAIFCDFVGFGKRWIPFSQIRDRTDKYIDISEWLYFRIIKE